MKDSVTIGLDVGGTKVAGGLVTQSNETLAVRRRPTSVDGSRDPGLSVTLALAEELAEEGRAMGVTVDGIGAGFPEYVDPVGRLRSHEVLAWTSQPAELLAHLGPVTIESDVRCAALGEGAAGVARGLDDYVFVIVGTGLSHTLVQGGRPRRGARGEAIALGELEVSRHVATADPITLERFASGDAIRERFGRLTGSDVAGAIDVFRLAGDGNDVALSIVRSAGHALGEGLAAVVALLDPRAVVIGGGVSAATGPWRDGLLSAYEARVRRRPDPPPVLWASRRTDGGIIGAAIAHRLRSRGPA